MVQGPWPCSCRIVSPSAQAKCFVPAGQKPNEPVTSAVVDERSNRSPIPRCSVPLMTVACSVWVCQCGNTWRPSGNRRRIVNIPGWVGSPSRMAILAPFGNDGGPSFHSSSVPGKRAIGLLAWPAAAVGIVNRSRLKTWRCLIGGISSHADPAHFDSLLGSEDALEQSDQRRRGTVRFEHVDGVGADVVIAIDGRLLLELIHQEAQLVVIDGSERLVGDFVATLDHGRP